MKLKFDYTPVLKRKIEDMIHDLRQLPVAANAVRELRILHDQLKTNDEKEEKKEIHTSQ